MVALAPALDAPTATYAALAQGGASVTLASDGLTAPRVDIVAPRAVAQALRAALGWRIAAMGAQYRAGRALVARPGLALPLTPVFRARVQRETGEGKRYWVDLSAQRAEPGACPSCGEAHAASGDTGDCALCNAARVAALRAEGALPAAEARAVETHPTFDAWRGALYAEVARPAPLPPAASPTWTCAKCGARVTGQRDRDDECGPCELRRISTCDTSWLGGRP